MRALSELEEELAIHFSDRSLLEKALRHKSYIMEQPEQGLEDNERLEFLGDSVLDLVISEYIYKAYQDHTEGDLAKIRAVVVSAPVLAGIAKTIALGSYIFLGRGEEISGGRKRENLLADTFEALIGAIYLDQGLEQARQFILGNLEDEVQAVEAGEHIHDFKTMLQEITQKKYNTLPHYEVVKEEGPEHNKRFLVQVALEDKPLGQGQGTSKKEAEQRAAKEAVQELE
ncbi:MAG: ribonuclease III [Halanaerobium sp.]|nr:ribonuclease III [Halanaerobium sp.]